jgi:L,D-transpeptidase YcbB
MMTILIRAAGIAALCLVAALVACAPVRERPEEPTPPPVGAWSPSALANLMATAQAAPLDGLPAEDDALRAIEALRSGGANDADAVAQLDIAADALFASLARRFAQGAVADPVAADPEWRLAPPPTPDLEALLARRVAGEPPSSLLRGLAPQSADYLALRDELARVSAEPEGALDAHGRSREARLLSLHASLERWRWLPRELPPTRIEVRITHFEAVLFKDGARLLTHAAIVGARRTPTPSFAAEIRSLTLNPYWEPPRSITIGELLPRFARNPAAAARENYEVLDTSGRSVPLASVDWTARPFPYRLRQRPGPGNALGRIRFDMPNPFAIYLHDTPSRNLFARADRALSHGCIRIENPVELAAAMSDADAWSAETLNAQIDAGATSAVNLDSALPIYILYITAAMAPDGSIAYADDLYGRDAAVVAALDAPDFAQARERTGELLRCPA